MLAKLDVRTKAFWLVTGYLLIALLGAIDAQFKPEVVFAPLYLIPIAILAWFVGKWNGVTASVLSTMMWLAADLYSGGPYESTFVYYWNTIVCLTTFLLTSWLISYLRVELEQNRSFYQLDTLTGIANSVGFHEAAQREIERAKRLNRPFSLGYIDVDNFKFINEQMGHTIGDQVIREIALNIQSNLRRSDLVARVGGDEFTVLLSEAGQEASREAINRIQHQLKNAMDAKGWPLTFSIGVIACIEHPKTVDELLQLTSELRDFVKHNGKDGICFSEYKSKTETQINR
jgi:diguanylate cyclase (GGDEF)-like protein